MSSRVLKKVSTPFEQVSPDGAILVVNLYDPQISTMKVFIEAVHAHKLPFLVVGNKVDLVKDRKIIKSLERELGTELLPVSLLTSRDVESIEAAIVRQFTAQKRIIVLGVFNSGKTSLISKLTGETLEISDLPGTTQEFTPHTYKDKVLVDTIGQVIDISKPMMVSIDLSGCRTTRQKIARVMQSDADGILATKEMAIPQVERVIAAINTQIKKGKKLVVTGAGASALVAMEMAGQAQETGVPVMVFTNNLADAQPVSFSKGVAEDEGGLSAYMSRAIERGDVAVGISASGGTGFVYDFLKRARQRKAVTVAITENPDTPLGKMADYIIKSNAKPEGPSSSKIQAAHLAIVHAIIIALADVRGVSADESIKHMLKDEVSTKKMGIK